MTDMATRAKYPWEITSENRTQFEAVLTEKWGGYVPALRDHLVRATPVVSQYRLGNLMERVAHHNTGWAPIGDAAKLIPLDARKALGYGKTNSYPSNIKATLITPRHGGQQQGGDSNIIILCEPYWYGDDFVYVEVEVGCRHEWSTRNLGRCYNEHKCLKCGAWYKVDSGD